MTCVVGYMDKVSRVMLMGTDAAGYQSHLVRERTDKYIVKAGEFLIGTSGSCRVSQIIEYDLNIPEVSLRIDLRKYMVTKFAKALKDRLHSEADYKLLNKDDLDWTALIALRGRLFALYRDFQIAETALPYFAIGAGQQYALGALTVLNGKEGARSKVMFALKAAGEFVPSVCPPYRIKTLKYGEA